MKTIIQGDIEDLEPIFYGFINHDGNLQIGKNNRDTSFTVDTGFSGGIALPKDMLDRIGIEFLCFDTFTLGTGEVIELPIYYGTVIVNSGKIKYEVTTWFIEGDYMIGMHLLSAAGSMLTFNFKKKKVKLMK